MKTPFALLINDLHIDTDNISEFEKNWDEALDVMHSRHIYRIIVGGDVFTTRKAQQLKPILAVNQCIQSAIECGYDITLVEGNHDKPVYDESDGWLDMFANNEDVSVHDNYVSFELSGGIMLLVMSYWPENGMFEEKLQQATKRLSDDFGVKPDRIILYIHEGVHGALGDFDIPNEVSQEVLKPYMKVLCGHYHNRTKIKDTEIEYIGSSRAHTFGEDEEKGYTILYDDGSTEFVKNKVNIRYVTDDVKLKELNDWKRSYGQLYKVRLRIHCQSSEVDTVDKDELLSRGANKIEFVTEKIQAIAAESASIDEKFDSKNLQIEYKHFCSEKDIDARMGIQYLSKI